MVIIDRAIKNETNKLERCSKVTYLAREYIDGRLMVFFALCIAIGKLDPRVKKDIFLKSYLFLRAIDYGALK